MSLCRYRSLVLTGLLALLGALPAQAQNSMVRLHTSQGPIDLTLLDAQAPRSVANFRSYADAGTYSDTLVHRSVRNFVIQGGGFVWRPGSPVIGRVLTAAPLKNEFSADRSNLRGTVAMARLGRSPDGGVTPPQDTATSQWFINLRDNTALDTADGAGNGFTVFARVTVPSMPVVDRIAALPIYNASWVPTVGSSLGELPVLVAPSTVALARANAVIVQQVTTFPPLAAQSESDRIFNYLEAAYPQYLSPSIGAAGVFEGYTYRHYSASGAYVGTKDGKVLYLVPALGSAIGELGSMADWLATAQAAGY